MAQMKEQIKTPEKELNKMEISNLSDVDSKHWILGCSKKSLGTATAKKTQAEMKVTLNEITKNLQGTSGGDEARF